MSNWPPDKEGKRYAAQIITSLLDEKGRGVVAEQTTTLMFEAAQRWPHETISALAAMLAGSVEFFAGKEGEDALPMWSRLLLDIFSDPDHDDGS